MDKPTIPPSSTYNPSRNPKFMDDPKMPRVVGALRNQPHSHSANGYDNTMAQHYANQDKVLIADILFDLLWPVTGWGIALFNFGVMFSTLWNMLNNYNSWAHAQAALVTILSFGAVAIIYRKVLKIRVMQPTVDKEQFYNPPNTYNQT